MHHKLILSCTIKLYLVVIMTSYISINLVHSTVELEEGLRYTSPPHPTYPPKKRNTRQ